MYRITADGVTIYNSQSPIEKFKVIKPSLTMSDGSAGKLTFTLPPANQNNDILVTMATTIKVYRNGWDNEIWEGRIISEDKDFRNNRKFTCEGELGYLNDVIQPIDSYHDLTVRQWLETLISYHNSRVAPNRQFTVGDVTVTSEDYAQDIFTDYENTMVYIKAMVDALGGHLRIRKENGVRYLDYLVDEYDRMTNQEIKFGKNLIDFTSNWDLTNLATVVIPLGEQLSSSLIENATDYLTIEEVNQGKIYLESPEAVQTYGRIETVVHFDDIADATELKEKGEEYLRDSQFADIVFKCSAIDLTDLGVSTDDLRVRDRVRVVSPLHGMDRYFTISEVSLDLDNVSNSKYTIGLTDKQALNSRAIEANASLSKNIANRPSYGDTLRKAKEDAAKMVSMATTGVISITQNEHGAESLIISPTYDWQHESRYWMWNLNGLVYTDDGGQTSRIGITMDGKINADFITVGSMSADRIYGGTLTVGGQDNVSGRIFVKNAAGTTIASINNDGIKLSADSVLTFDNASFADRVTVISQDAVTAENIKGQTITGKTMNTCEFNAGLFQITSSGLMHYGGTGPGFLDAPLVCSNGAMYTTNGNINTPIMSGAVQFKRVASPLQPAIGAINPGGVDGVCDWEIGGIYSIGITGSTIKFRYGGAWYDLKDISDNAHRSIPSQSDVDKGIAAYNWIFNGAWSQHAASINSKIDGKADHGTYSVSNGKVKI